VVASTWVILVAWRFAGVLLRERWNRKNQLTLE
jgi:hypothetical protein